MSAVRSVVRPAEARDLTWARELLTQASLPTQGLEDQFPRAYAVLEEDGKSVGLAGLERYGRFGLLRSVAVSPRQRGSGGGSALVSDRLAAAGADGVESVFLLTTTADRWFPRFGFRPVERASLPPEIAASPEASVACPDGAAVLRLDFGPG
ncbi:MAG: arsenic resistance N-acetyltransferase ArsN2 [Gemmatimonadales bacterium]